MEALELTSAAGGDRLGQPVAGPGRGGGGRDRALRRGLGGGRRALGGRPRVDSRAPERGRARRGLGRRPDAAAVRTPRHGRRRRDGRAVRAAGRRRPPVRARRLRHEGGAGRRLLACREAARLGLRGRRGRRRGRRRGAREPRRAGGAARSSAPTRRSSPSRPSCRVVVAHKGFVWSEITLHGVAAHGSRPHLGVDAIAAAGPVLTRLGELDIALARARPPAARSRVGPRVADRRRRGALQLPGPLRARRSSGGRCRARPPPTSRPRSRR